MNGTILEQMIELQVRRNRRRSLNRLGLVPPPVPPLDLHALSASELDHQMRRLGGQIRESLNLRQVAGEGLDRLLGTRPRKRSRPLRLLRFLLSMPLLPFLLAGRVKQTLRDLLTFSHALQVRLVRHEEMLAELKDAQVDSGEDRP